MTSEPWAFPSVRRNGSATFASAAMAFYEGVASRNACPTFTHRIEYTGTDAAHITVGNFSSDYRKTVKMYYATTTDGERR